MDYVWIGAYELHIKRVSLGFLSDIAGQETTL